MLMESGEMAKYKGKSLDEVMVSVTDDNGEIGEYYCLCVSVISVSFYGLCNFLLFLDFLNKMMRWKAVGWVSAFGNCEQYVKETVWSRCTLGQYDLKILKKC
mgnify:CR=1 FL=1